MRKGAVMAVCYGILCGFIGAGIATGNSWLWVIPATIIGTVGIAAVIA